MDAFDGPHGWVYHDLYTPSPVNPETVGFLMESYMENYMTLCSSYYYDEESRLVYSNPMHIPEAMVVSIEQITH